MQTVIINSKIFYETNYEGYFVSKDGVIISFRKPKSRSTPDKRIDMNSAPKYLAYKIDKDGYFEILFSVNKKRTSKKVHQIVAETFLGQCPIGYCVDHIDRNRQNNNLSNLRYIPWSLNSDGQKGRIPKSAKKCLCNGVLYPSILKACKANNIPYRSVITSGPTARRRITIFKGVETIEIF